jgi:hypothetical protein
MFSQATQLFYLPFKTKYFPKDKNHDPAAIYGYGFAQHYGGNENSGSLPQSALPLGVPLDADEPALNLTQIREEILRLVSLLDTEAAANVPAAQALRESVHERDVHVAAKNLPKLSGAGREPKG